MASFFQPPTSGDPVIIACNAANSTNTASAMRLVYCNKLLAPGQRLKTPLQYFTLILALLCLAFPLLVCFAIRFSEVFGVGGRRRKRGKGPTKQTFPIDLKSLSSIQSFACLDSGSSASGLAKASKETTALLLPLPSFAETESGYPPLLRSRDLNPNNPVFGVVEASTLSQAALPIWTNFLSNLVCKDKSVLAIVIRIVDSAELGGREELPEFVIELLWQLHSQRVPVLLNFHHDDSSVARQVDLGLLVGIIIENACILPDGQRRDYFHSRPLREAMSRCAGERARRPEFFVGFHDGWDKRPSAAVICRAVKLATHFGAVLEHHAKGETTGRLPLSMSGFVYLRKAEVTELQKIWIQQRRKVHVGISNMAEEQVARLDLGELRSILPDIESLLSPFPVLAEHGAELKAVPPPEYVHLAPPRADFWESSADGEPISLLGCVPLTVAATRAQYDSVLEAQCHLRDLSMLHRLDDTECAKLVEDLMVLQPVSHESGWIRALIRGLSEQNVIVYRGLGTAFTVPDTATEFWGLSVSHAEENSTSVDIFISRRCPSDAATVLHTWLAHHGCPRLRRYEEELRFERAGASTSTVPTPLPLSIKSAIERATPSEALFLLQQLQVAQLRHQFSEAIERYCKVVLIDRISVESWNDAHSRQFLDGSLGMRHLLERRLADFTRSGATTLPSVDNLLTLYADVKQLIDNGLFSGNSNVLNIITGSLLHVFDPLGSCNDCDFVDINADLITLMFLCALRASALEDVYLEATDHCPIFSQSDQAAVFSELWVVGSQCELYFSVTPRALGKIIHNRHRNFLGEHPPPTPDNDGERGPMTAYVKPEPPNTDTDKVGNSIPWRLARLRRIVAEFGAVSIFCLPAMLDIVLLTFVGRGLFMTAYMGDDHLMAACYALLVSLLLSAGVTGWVGSVGNYYLCHYAYGNMVHFHVQRLSGGLILSLLVGVFGATIISIKVSHGPALTFFAYLVLISMYLNILGILATMHQPGSPLVSGRTVLWRTMPVLFISPIVSSCLGGHDLAIYLSVGYGFLPLALLQYRRLCHQWMNWTDNIPKLAENDILEWYSSRARMESSSDNGSEASIAVVDTDLTLKLALRAFRESVASHQRAMLYVRGAVLIPDTLVQQTARGLPCIEWLLQRESQGEHPSEPFSVSWFAQLSQALKKQQQMAQGLKEHSIFMLFRYARFDIGQNVGLFLICLMDRWVSITMSIRSPPLNIFSDFTSRYAICFAILYFCGSVMVLDSTLQDYWHVSFGLSGQKLTCLDDANTVTRNWEGSRRHTYLTALLKLCCRVVFVFGCCSIFVWCLVDDLEMVVLYYSYILAYSAVILFQFNRCFTTNIRAHIISIIMSAATGFITGCVMHVVAEDDPFLFTDVIALNFAAIMAAILTSIWAWKDPSSASVGKRPRQEQLVATVWQQPRLGQTPMGSEAASVATQIDLPGVSLSVSQETPLSREVSKLLRLSTEQPSHQDSDVPWAAELRQTASGMWSSNQIRVILCPRSTFAGLGLGDMISFSRLQGDVLELSIGIFGSKELNLTSWERACAEITTELILHHISRAIMGFSADKAVHAEHLLRPADGLSQTIKFQIAMEDRTRLCSIKSQMNGMLLHNLCLGFNVDVKWNQLPLAVRDTIVRRVIQEPLPASGEYIDWGAYTDVDADTSNFHVQLCLAVYSRVVERLKAENETVSFAHPESPPTFGYLNIAKSKFGLLQCVLNTLIQIPTRFTKWVGIISGAGSNVERELFHSFRHYPSIRIAALRIILLVWRASWHIANLWVYMILIYHHNALVNISRLARDGATRILHKSRIVVELRRRAVTGFITKSEQGFLQVAVFSGKVSEIPANTDAVFTALYDEHIRLTARCERSKEAEFKSNYTYGEDPKLRYPICKAVSNGTLQKTCYYDREGRVTWGAIIVGTSEYSFRYHYKGGPKGYHEVLKADFKLTKSPLAGSLTVYWGAPARGDLLGKLDWVPSDRVCRVVRKTNGQCFITTFDYQHRRDPMRRTVLREGPATAVVAWPPRLFDHEELLLQRPSDISFEADDLLIHHGRDQIQLITEMAENNGASLQSILDPRVWNYWRKKTVHRRIPTWWLRTELWSHWRQSGNLDAISACWVDEHILRGEPLLRDYWRARNTGQLIKAKNILDAQIEQIAAAIDIDKEVSEVCMLPIKTTDLYAMGLGKDANHMTMWPQGCFHDTKERISVIFNDTGCWPDSPGGVSNCRRDLVDGHSTIRNHVLAECANEYGIPRFQVERNVRSIKLLPLWGLDGRTPNHGLTENLLESVVDEKIADTKTDRDIVGAFVPLLNLFVKGARSRSISRRDMLGYTDVLLAIFEYFEHKDYNKTWNSKAVAAAWVEAWLTDYNDTNIADPGEHFDIEKPSMSDFHSALSIYSSYFFIFSVQTPTECPKVFQSTHHGISSLFGIFLKYRRGATFGIWDHAILWRECCLNLSPAQSTLPVPVQSMLLAGIGLAMRLAYFHADVVLPCTPVFNPIWEADLGTDSGRLGHKNQFRRKIDPIVNGVSNMDAFKPVDKIRTTTPTVVMLSNVQFIKDIKTAIFAADVIVNRYGFHDYQLHIYGARDREPGYDVDMANLINSRHLTSHVVLKGFGKPSEALQDAWLFMNSSLSEGLPLAIAEAALSGVPIVATAVGATALVLTDPDDPAARYGEVVPPNDPTALARAQISVLAMVGPWAKFAGDVLDKRGPVPPNLMLPEALGKKEVEWLGKRMYEKAEARRALGMLGRQVVLRGFHGKRYLREHEQMYWAQWHLAKMRRNSAGSRVSGDGAEGGREGIGSSRLRDLAEMEQSKRRKLKKRRREGQDMLDDSLV
ncbi:hypothetical protein B0H67DRAFT_543007 [Lasiosphaeris hirsuta]|uniref:DUF3492 domain-containing protein n=1 Tax=Lasiosphaeris hirsuta TaxID=260670 RepID=A0AA40A1X2_9PEZI|nr:hypothetical protein B0H67DRAFT_543007 [Lasiosphaeris hirsuta]